MTPPTMATLPDATATSARTRIRETIIYLPYLAEGVTTLSTRMKLVARTSSDWKILAWTDTHRSDCDACDFEFSDQTLADADGCKRTGRFRLRSRRPQVRILPGGLPGGHRYLCSSEAILDYDGGACLSVANVVLAGQTLRRPCGDPLGRRRRRRMARADHPPGLASALLLLALKQS